MYAKAFRGEIKNFTGVDDPYEEPLNPEITLNTHEETLGSASQSAWPIWKNTAT